MGKTFHYGDWEYKKNIGSHDITISKYLGSDTEVTVPAQIDNFEVYDLDSFVFSESPANVNVKRVVLSEGIRKIGSLALSSSNIQEVVLPSTMQEIDKMGFSEIIQRVTVNPNNPYFFDIDGVLFSGKPLNMHLVFFPAGRTGTYKIPDGTTHIEQFAFLVSKNLKQVVMPDSVWSVESKAFSNCIALKSVTLSPSIAELRMYVFYNCLELADVRVSRKIKTISPNTFKGCPKFKGINIQTRMSVQER
jgi:hypothetical protein